MSRQTALLTYLVVVAIVRERAKGLLMNVYIYMQEGMCEKNENITKKKETSSIDE